MAIRDVLNNYNDEQGANHGSTIEEALKETLSTLGSGLPDTTPTDVGKVLKVNLKGEWALGSDDDQELPPVTADDNGKTLKVVDGAWAAGPGLMNVADGTGTNGVIANSLTGDLKNIASGEASFAEGKATKATGNNSHAEGSGTRAQGDYSHAEGSNSTTASGDSSHAEGSSTTASGNSSHAEGSGTKAVSSSSHAEGIGTKATSLASHAEGYKTNAGNLNDSTKGKYSHAEGQETDAAGDASHSEGYKTEADGYGAHAEGYNAFAKGAYSHAEGSVTEAIGVNSHAEGQHTTANANQHVSGKYNVADTTSAEIIGNGTGDNARSNARTLDWSGNEWLAGTITPVGGVILTAPNGTLYKLVVSDDGTLSTEELVPS